MQLISESTNGIAIAFSCSVGEISGDTELGSSYTYSLLKTSLQWNESQNTEGVLTISDANDLAHEHLKIITHFEQNSQIRTLSAQTEKLNFPFAVKTNSL